jgi:hypothetical protein
MINQSFIKTVFESLFLDLWYQILSLLDIPDALANSIADPRTFGAFIEDKQTIRNSNAFNSTPSSLFRLVLKGELVGYSSFLAFHQACDDMGKCVVVVRAENRRIAAVYNEDGFSSNDVFTPNLNGFIVSIKEDGSCGARFNRNGREHGTWNRPGFGPDFWGDISISNNCNKNEESFSILGWAHGEGANRSALFGQESFRVSEYEVFKIGIE